MNITIKSHEKLIDDIDRYIVQVPAEELVYFGYIIEAFEGFCNYSTITVENEKLIQVDASPDYNDIVMEIIDFLKEWEL